MRGREMKTSSLALYISKETYIYEKKPMKETPYMRGSENLVCNPEDGDFLPSPPYIKYVEKDVKRDLCVRKETYKRDTIYERYRASGVQSKRWRLPP